jgi:hypothetical protein
VTGSNVMLAFSRKKKKRGYRLVLGLHNDAMERILVLRD